ncbi:MAG: sugar phosphate nucleotidyltransferase [Thermodesulfobium sp.]
MKGVILAGGSGTRLRPITKYLNKHLFPVYDRPMILFSLDTMKKVGIKDLMLVLDRYAADKIIEFLGSGEDFGVSITYKIQEKPDGIASALGLCEAFVGNDSVLVMLGDNIVFDNLNKDILDFRSGCKVFLKRVENPTRFGVPEFGNKQEIKNIIEKPEKPASSFAVTGVYIFDNTVFEKIRLCKTSQRGELEITDVLNEYAKGDKIRHRELESSWIDAGTFESLYEASTFVREINKK